MAISFARPIYKKPLTLEDIQALQADLEAAGQPAALSIPPPDIGGTPDVPVDDQGQPIPYSPGFGPPTPLTPEQQAADTVDLEAQAAGSGPVPLPATNVSYQPLPDRIPSDFNPSGAIQAVGGALDLAGRIGEPIRNAVKSGLETFAQSNPEAATAFNEAVARGNTGVSALSRPLEAVTNKTQEAAGLGTLGIKAVGDPGRIVRALTDAGVTEADAPWQAIEKVGQHYYKDDSIPFVTGLMEQLPWLASPVKLLQVAKEGAVAKMTAGEFLQTVGSPSGVESLLGRVPTAAERAAIGSGADIPGLARGQIAAASEGLSGQQLIAQQTAHAIGTAAQQANEEIGRVAQGVGEASARGIQEAMGPSSLVPGAADVIGGARKVAQGAGEAKGAFTPEAEALLKTVDEGGVPSTVTARLRQIAIENGVEFTAASTPNDIIDGLRAKQALPHEAALNDAEKLAAALPEKPNAATGAASLRKAEKAGHDITDAQDALDEYKAIQRADYEDAESFHQDRTDAWDAFRDTLAQSEKAAYDELATGTTSAETRQAERLGQGELPEYATVGQAVDAHKSDPGAAGLFIRWDSKPLKAGDRLAPSREWLDGTPTTSSLSGTSAINPVAQFSRGDLASSYEGRPYLVRGEVIGHGEDTGEVLLRNAEVVKPLSGGPRSAEPPITAADQLANIPRAGNELPTGKPSSEFTPPASTPRPPIAPTPTPDGKGFEYSLPTSLVEDGVVPGEMLHIPQYYAEQRNTIGLMTARADLGEPAEITMRRLTDTPRWNDVDGADAILLMSKLGRRGDVKAIHDFNLVMRERGVDIGRAEQIFTAMKKMSPEGAFTSATNILEKVVGNRAARTAKNIGKAAESLQGKAAETAKTQGDQLISEAEAATVQGRLEVANLRVQASKAAKAEVDPASAIAPPKTPTAALNRLDKAVRYLENEGRAPGMPGNADELMAQLSRTTKLAQDTGWLMEHPEAKDWLRQVEAIWGLPAAERNGAARGLIQQLVDTHLPTMEARSVAWKEASANLALIDRTVGYLRRDWRPRLPSEVNDALKTMATAKRLAQQTGWIMNDPTARLWLDDADRIVSMGVGQAQVDATKAFIESTKGTLIPHLESLKKTQAELLREARYKDIMTGKLIPEAKQRAENLARDAQNRSQQIVLKNGLALDPDVAAAFWERAQNIGKLAPGAQQNREYQKFMSDVKNFIPPTKWEKAIDLYGLPRALKSTWDASYMLRQGALLGLRNPKLWLETWGTMLGSGRDSKFAEQIMENLTKRPLANLTHEMGVALDEIYGTSEFFSSKVANRIPGVSAAERMFVIPGNKLRNEGVDGEIMRWLPKGWDVAAPTVRNAEGKVIGGRLNSIADAVSATGKTEQDFKDLGLLYNALSGKSNVQFLKDRQGLGRILNLAFFAPSWTLSIPEAVIRTAAGSPAIRKIGAETLVGYFGSVMAVETLGAVSGVWDAEQDPRSTNFGKVRFKGTYTWFDPTLGAGILLRIIAQMAPTLGPHGLQPYHKDASGNIVPQGANEALGKFLRGKLNPVVGEWWNWVLGQDSIGDKRRFGPSLQDNIGTIGRTLESLFAPLTPDDLFQGIQADGLRGGLLALPSIIGGSDTTYQSFADQQQQATDSIFPGKRYGDLPRGDQRKVNDSAEMKAAVSKFSDTPIALKDLVKDRFAAKDQAMKELETGRPAAGDSPAIPGIKDYIDAGMPPGKALKEKIQTLKHDAYLIAAKLLTPDVLAASSQDKTIPLVDIYAQQWLNVPLPEDLVTGERDFKSQALARQDILFKAQNALKEAGKTTAYITDRGPGNFRAKQWSDPKVQALIDQYDADQETLRPYWKINDDLLTALPVNMGDVYGQRIDKNKEYRDAQVEWQHEQLRRKNPTIQAAGKKWGYFGDIPATLPTLPPIRQLPRLPLKPATAVPAGPQPAPAQPGQVIA